MSFSDFIGILSFLLAISAWLFPNALSPIRKRVERWREDRKFTGVKRQLRSTRRTIAQLKLSRTSSYRIEYMASLVFYSICALGASSMVIFAIGFEQSLGYAERAREKAQNTALVFAFLFYVLSVFGRFSRTPRAYRERLQKLQNKRNRLLIELKNAKTN